MGRFAIFVGARGGRTPDRARRRAKPGRTLCRVESAAGSMQGEIENRCVTERSIKNSLRACSAIFVISHGECHPWDCQPIRRHERTGRKAAHRRSPQQNCFSGPLRQSSFEKVRLLPSCNLNSTAHADATFHSRYFMQAPNSYQEAGILTGSWRGTRSVSDLWRRVASDCP